MHILSSKLVFPPVEDALEDGLLMEVSEAQMRQALHQLVDDLINPYPGNKTSNNE